MVDLAPLSDADAVHWILTTSHCWYTLLRVSRTSSQEDIRASYKRLALQCHPDKNTHPKAAEAFKTLNNAYATLSKQQDSVHELATDTPMTSTFFRSGPPSRPPSPPSGCDLHKWFKKRQEDRESKRDDRSRQEHTQNREESAAVRRLQWLSRLKKVCMENEGLLMELHIADWSNHRTALMKECRARCRAMLKAMADAPHLCSLDIGSLEGEVEVAEANLREERLEWEARQSARGLDADTSYAGWERRVSEKERQRGKKEMMRSLLHDTINDVL